MACCIYEYLPFFLTTRVFFVLFHCIVWCEHRSQNSTLASRKWLVIMNSFWRIINFSLSKHLRISRGRPTCTFSERLEAIEKIYLGFFNRVSTIAGIIFNSSLAHLKNLTVAYNWFKQRQLNLSPAASSFISNP